MSPRRRQPPWREARGSREANEGARDARRDGALLRSKERAE